MKQIYFIFGIIAMIVLISGCEIENNALEIRNVKYFFDNIEQFNENLPRAGISEEVIIKGKLIEEEVEVLCVTEPCLSVKKFALQDINDENYKITIFETNQILQQLEIGKVYILKGILEKDVDFGRKIVYISNFKPVEVVK